MLFATTFRTWLTWPMLAAMALVVPAAASAEVMVIDSIGPSAAQYPRGTKLADDAMITLQQGDGLILLDAGGTRSLKGPVTMRLDAPSSAARARTQLVVNSLRNTVRARAGVVRTPAPAADGGFLYDNEGPTTLWFVDIDKGGGFCVVDKAMPLLFRKQVGSAKRLRIDPANGGEGHLMYLPLDSNEVPWPKGITDTSKGWLISDLDADAGQTPVAVYARYIEIGDDDPVTLVDTLMTQGCDAQFDYALQKLRNRQREEVIPLPGSGGDADAQQDSQQAPEAM
ncbi:MAG: hypothetical protein AAGH53_06735 [Pseudomonadota bacterium]